MILPTPTSVQGAAPNHDGAMKTTGHAKTTPPPAARILYAEDNPEMRTMMVGVLAWMGCHLETAQDGQEAFAAIVKQPDAFRLLITDHASPRLSGLDLVKQLRGTAFRGKVVVLSAYLTSVEEAQCRAEGVDKIFFKPPNLSWLRQAIQESLNQTKSAMERVVL